MSPAIEDKRNRILLKFVAVIFTSGCEPHYILAGWKMDFTWKWYERKLLIIGAFEINISVFGTTGKAKRLREYSDVYYGL